MKVNATLWLQDDTCTPTPMNSLMGCFRSMFRMHTETWNIWTHFLGFMFFLVLCLGIYVYGDYITYVVLREEIEEQHIIQGITRLLMMGGMYIFGAIIYVSRVSSPGSSTRGQAAINSCTYVDFVRIMMHYPCSC